MITKAPKGTKDVLPNEVYKWQAVEARFREVAARFGFLEIRTPVFEHTELFARGIGDATDVVEKQMYTFDDLGGRSLSLRPEGTAGAARAYVENKLYAGVKPLKLWYELSCFRYEKPQSGRLREFHQFGVEIFGSKDMLADAEVIAVADVFLRGLGLRELSLRVNSIGCPVCRPVYRKQLLDYLEGHREELCDTCKGRLERNPMRVLDCKSPVCQGIAAGAPLMIDALCDECRDDFASLQANLTALGVAFEIDPHIVRGLDYYTKTAFEFVSEQIGAQGTVCGGGRYDHLVCEVADAKPGSDLDVPGVGFGLGIERLLLVLEAGGVEIPVPQGPDALVVYLSGAGKAEALRIAKELRAAGFIIEIDAAGRGMKGQFKYADHIGARHAIVLGDEELAAGEATVKDMTTGEQRRVAADALAAALQGASASGS
ncbi:MAG: histidine--tRNA ligase [Clostridiales Family XIII bacterium]|jgi:histidyl-tRNA synthetase|nr:histidine--tRNA ligase [Clostridiales Family XIII bacterium]